MTEEITQSIPSFYLSIHKETTESGFTMASDMLTCSLLRTLAACKPAGKFLELGTGTGLSTAWILDGMDSQSTLTSIDNDQTFLSIAGKYLAHDQRLNLLHTDGGEWVRNNAGQKFDYIFADTWHGKYLLLNEVLEMLNVGALYIVDDMLPQPNWPEGHAAKVSDLIARLEQSTELVVTKMNWSTGIIVATKLT